MHALLTAMEGCSAFWASSSIIGVGRQSNCATETSCGGYRLNQARKLRAGDIEGYLGALWARFIEAVGIRVSSSFLIAVLSVFAISVHALIDSLKASIVVLQTGKACVSNQLG